VAFFSVIFNTYIAPQMPADTFSSGTNTPAIIDETDEHYVSESQVSSSAQADAKPEKVKNETVPKTVKAIPEPSPANPVSLANERIAEAIKQLSAPEETLIPQAQLNESAREVVVNMFCLTKTSGMLEPITGSGVIIDEKGVILTNAHVAQYLLLKDYGIKDFLNCVIRGESPAKPLYKAKLLYMPPTWIEKNALNLKSQKPKGTGEDDYALLYIIAPTRTGTTLPETIPATSFDVSARDINVDDPVLIASYPAGFLGGIDVTKNLWISSSIARIVRLYTFREIIPHTEDAFSVGGTIIAQEGASGGGVFSLKTGKLVGLLATSILGGTTDERDLRAISLRHVNQSMQENTGEGLETFLSGNLKQKSAEFNSTIAPQLTQILTDVLEGK